MFWISGVWDEAMRRKFVGLIGIASVLGVAYAGAAASGTAFFIRLVF